jgi:tRNA pseudouridine38-40 synthase
MHTDTNRVVRVPIAPAEGLVLLSSSFGGKLHAVSLYADHNTPLATEEQDISHRVLLGAIEDRAMQTFRENVIYQEVIRAWGDVSEGEQWQAYLAKSFAANESIDEAELTRLLEEADQRQQARTQRHLNYVETNRATEIDETRVRDVLPRQFTTKLCVRYSIAPGIYTTDLRRGIAWVRLAVSPFRFSLASLGLTDCESFWPCTVLAHGQDPIDS